MVNIPLGSGWTLQSDHHNWILSRAYGKRTKVDGFYSSLEVCLTAYLEKRTRDSTAASAEALLSHFRNVVLALNRALLPLKIQFVTQKEETDKKESQTHQMKGGNTV